MILGVHIGRRLGGSDEAALHKVALPKQEVPSLGGGDHLAIRQLDEVLEAGEVERREIIGR